MQISRLIVGLTAVALLSACGDSGRIAPQATPLSVSSREFAPAEAVDAVSVFVKVALCFRAHEHPEFPDPVQAPDGSWGFPVTADRIRVPEECVDIVRRSKELSGSSPRYSSAPADLTEERAFASCMRDTGISDWPDPNPDGTFTIPERLSDPRDESQWKPKVSGRCKQFLPDGEPDIVLTTPR
jgi:hypothetical protein